MINFLKILLNLFSRTPTYSLGAEESPFDVRNISLAQIQKPVELPPEYETEMPFVENQGSKPKCVASAISKVKELYLKEKGKELDLSDDDLYALCKEQDGIPEVGGTYPTIGAKIVCKVGIASVDVFKNGSQEAIKLSRATNKLGGYAFVSSGYDAICQAIYQNKAIVASFAVDVNWFLGLITKVLKSIGRHMVILHGFRRNAGVIIGQNSWGVGWIGRIVGIINAETKPGHFELLWSDYENTVSDIIAFTDIPDIILEEAKKQDYYFINTLRKGSRGYEVKKLQERLGMKADGVFGDITVQKVKVYQFAHSLVVDGIVGPKMRDSLNNKISKLDLWCEAIKKHEGWFVGSRSYKNNNPGNLKYVGQKSATGKDSGGFCIFPTYEIGYNELRNLLIRACTGKSSVYRPEMTLYEFYAKYAPDFDNNDSKRYAEAVAKFISVSPETKIKLLL